MYVKVQGHNFRCKINEKILNATHSAVILKTFNTMGAPIFVLLHNYERSLG